MTQDTITGNSGTTAPLTNVSLFSDLIAKLIDRPAHLPGLGVFYGFSGYGKTWSARYGRLKSRAYYLECGESWTRARFLRSALEGMGEDTKGAASSMIDRVINNLRATRRPLIIDEADHIIRRGYIETIREIADASGAPVILMGEEKLPQMIERASERVHNRVLLTVAAQPGGAKDAAILGRLYHVDVNFGPDMLEAIAKASGGRLRRIVTNLYNVASEAEIQGWTVAGLEQWGARDFYTGGTPALRRP